MEMQDADPWIKRIAMKRLFYRGNAFFDRSLGGAGQTVGTRHNYMSKINGHIGKECVMPHSCRADLNIVTLCGVC